MGKTVKEIETRTVRMFSLEEIEQALCDQHDLGIPGQDALTFEWRSAGPGGCPPLTGVTVTQIEHTTEML